MPPPPTSETIGGKKSTEWQEITNKAVDRRGSVTDVRLDFKYLIFEFLILRATYAILLLI